MPFPAIRLRDQLVIGLFFILWIGATVVSHMIGRELFIVAQDVRAAEAAKEPVPEERVEAVSSKAAGLAIVNLPLFVAVGPMMRAEDPRPGPLYWALVVVGCVYVPFFATLCVFFLVHAPSQGSRMPGVDWDDGSREENEEEISDDDADRKP
ncbi:hypothetical protein GC173_11155 [bacterium]|nr:hypothetical protein [bacterium]